jgi:hypothetical protein
VPSLSRLPHAVDPAEGPGTGRSRETLLPIVLVAALSVCLIHVAVRLPGPFWLDEFGSLWVVEAGPIAAVQRTLEAQAQSPLYYVFLALFRQLLGEHRWALRLPSLLSIAAALVLVFRCGVELGRPRVGLLAALLLGTHPVVLMTARIARPYGLAVAAAALLTWGFLRARAGRDWGRTLLVAGAVTLFYAHYVMAVLIAGVLAAWVLPQGRGIYRGRHLARDLSVAALLAIPGMLHLFQLVERVGEGATSYIAETFRWFTPLAPHASLLVVAVLGLLAAGCDRAVEWRLLGLLLAVPVLLELALAALGVHLITAHHISFSYVPSALLAAVAADGAWDRRGVLRTAALVAAVAHIAIGCAAVDRLFFQFGHQDWPGARASIQAQRQVAPGPVCYRSGFIEQEYVITHPEWVAEYSGFLLSTLRSPGRVAPGWTPLMLNHRWRHPGRREYLEGHIFPELEKTPVFYYLGSRFWRYRAAFIRSLEARIAGLEARPLYRSRGLEAWMFVCDRDATKDPASGTRLRSITNGGTGDPADTNSPAKPQIQHRQHHQGQ